MRLLTILWVLCVGALILVFINQASNAFIVSPWRSSPNFNAGNQSGASRPGFKPPAIHHPILDSIGLHERDMYEMKDILVASGHTQANASSQFSPILLIVAYFRTGSTFTASIFAERPSTFYMFEPLHVIEIMLEKKRYTLMINGTKRYINDVGAKMDLVIQTMQNWMNCSFLGLDRDSLVNHSHFSYNKNMRPFVMCMREQQYRFRASFASAINTCLPSAITRCATAHLRVYKLIRLRMASAEKLMNLFPNLKVIHLIRDPRGMFMSQVSVHLFDKNHDTIKTTCKDIMDDIKISNRLLREQKGRILVVRYEDIAYDPLIQTELLYRFANMTLDQRIINYVQQSTSLNLKNKCAYCTRRSNSTKTANKWRKNIDQYLLKAIDTHCQDVYKHLGYIPLDMKDIKNDSIPSMSRTSLDQLWIENI